MSARGRALLDCDPDGELAIIDCVCDGRLRVGIDTCGQCAGTFASILVLLDSVAPDAEGNPVWILAWALAHVIGRRSVDWDTVRRLAAEFEEPSRFQ